jgi:hypothetical protein
VPRYELLVDGDRVGRADSEDDVRTWLKRYREQHAEDDPAAAHVHVLRRGALGWLTGGRIEPRERFLS